MQIINYDAESVWGLFQKNKALLTQTDMLLAENPETGITITLSAYEDKNEFHLPWINVYIDGDFLKSEIGFDKADCEEVVERIYDRYLDTENLINVLLEREHDAWREAEQDEDEWLEEREYAIFDREDELIDATSDYLDTLLNDSLTSIVSEREANKIYMDFLDNVCEYLYKIYELPVFRPRFVKNNSGGKTYTEFPYEEE